MMYYNIHHRRLRAGVSLLEVVIAMGVMAIGFLALLTLFPLGAFQIGQALKDDRCAQLATHGDATVRTYWNEVVVKQNGTPQDSFIWAMDDPNLVSSVRPATSTNPNPYNTYITGPYLPTGWAPNTTAGNPISPTGIAQDLASTPSPAPPAPVAPPSYYITPGTRRAGPSYPVLLDSIGTWADISPQEKLWTAYTTPGFAGANLLIPRRKFTAFTDPFTGTQNDAFRLCALTDDMTFQQNGAPSASLIGRQARYTWSALVQREDNSNPMSASLTILVFDGRSPFSIPIQNEYMTTATPLVAGLRTITGLAVPTRTDDQPPLIRKGGWIMDGTITINTPPLPPTPRKAEFYRIVGVTEVSVTPTITTYNLDLDRPIVNGGVSQLYLFAYLAEVFHRDDLKPETDN